MMDLYNEVNLPKVYEIIRPEVDLGHVYNFTTDSGVEYEVRFGKKKKDFSSRVIDFSVLNEEFEEEYAETNRGEIYRVMATIIEIFKRYDAENDYARSYEFSGETKGKDDNAETSIRTKLYYRYASRILNDQWDIELKGNKMIIRRKKKSSS